MYVYILFAAAVQPEFIVVPHHVNSSDGYEFGPKKLCEITS